jgi:hypothetical protein
MEQTSLSKTFSPSIYNSLISVEEADEKAHQSGVLSLFLEEATHIFHKHNMQNRFGVALLHKHYECGENQHMIQYEEIIKDESALVTRPVHAAPQQEGAVPVIWSLIEGKYHPLEYSTDSLACELYRSGDIPQAFLEEFSDLLRFSPIGCQIGLAVVNRKLHENAPGAFGALEFSDLMDQSSVVLMRNRDEYRDRTIRTAWSFSFGGNDCVKSGCFIDGSGYHNPKKHVPKV